MASNTSSGGKHICHEETMVFTIRGFGEKNECITNAVQCHGHDWYLKIFPWGNNCQAKNKNFVSLYLHKDGASVKTEYSVRIGSTKKVETHEDFSKGWGWPEFTKREDAVRSLDQNGTLVVTVDIRCWLDEVPVWEPQNPLRRKLERLYDTGDKADITFNLQDASFVRAHKFLVSINCPLLNDIVSQASNPMKVVLDTPDPDLFAVMIRFMYYQALPKEFNMKRDGLNLLKLANQYDYTDLKIHVECELVRSGILTAENAAEVLLLADSQTFALLKEYAIDFVVKNFAEVVKSEGWKDLKESPLLLAELIEAQHAPNTEGDESVSALRQKLDNLGQEMDGTKEMLVQRLKEHKRGSEAVSEIEEAKQTPLPTYLARNEQTIMHSSKLTQTLVLVRLRPVIRIRII